jgi:predicted SnoaL-like aldol condensation-catalyzing enzyme
MSSTGEKSGPTLALMTTENKRIVQQALAGLIETCDVDTLAASLSDDFLHHRPDATVKTKGEWLAAVRAAMSPTVGMQIEILHLLSEDDHVMVHSRRRLPDGGPGVVVIDILRIDDGLVAEIWETIEPAGHAAANAVWWEVRPASVP